MGRINITVSGSFGNDEINITAEDHGHAHAVNKAMIWLNELMRKSINSDHRLHEKGHKPEKSFEVI